MKREDLLFAIEEEASYQKLIDVLRSVEELHRPFDDEENSDECGHCAIDYPCPTIQVIEKELQ